MNNKEKLFQAINKAQEPHKSNLLEIVNHPDTTIILHERSCHIDFTCQSPLDLKARYDPSCPYPYLKVDRTLYLEDPSGYYIIFLKKTIISGQVIKDFYPELMQNPSFTDCIKRFPQVFSTPNIPDLVKDFLLL